MLLAIQTPISRKILPHLFARSIQFVWIESVPLFSLFLFVVHFS